MSMPNAQRMTGRIICYICYVCEQAERCPPTILQNQSSMPHPNSPPHCLAQNNT